MVRRRGRAQPTRERPGRQRAKVSVARASVLFALLCLRPQVCGAEELKLPASFRPATAVSVGAALVVLAGGASTLALGPPATGRQLNWALDEEVRGVLQPRSFASMMTAKDVSDVLATVAVGYGIAIDPWVHALALRKSPQVGEQIFWINAEVLAITAGLHLATANLVGRERPFVESCGELLPEDAIDCHERDRNRSFYSAHTANVMAMGAASCSHALYLGLPTATQASTCSLGLVMGAATGVARMMADRHYLSDVLVGGVMGLGVGLLVPFLHYRLGPAPRAGGPAAATPGPTLHVLPRWGGLELWGAF